MDIIVPALVLCLLAASELLGIVSDHDIAVHGHERRHIFIKVRGKDVGLFIVASRRKSHESHEGIVEHVIGEWHISSFPHGLHGARVAPLVVIRGVDPEGNVYHRVVELVCIMPRTLSDLLAMVGEVEDAVRFHVVHGFVHDAFDDVVVKEDGVVILIIHDVSRRACLSHALRPVIELGRIAVPVTDMAAHEVDNDELAAVLRIDLPQIGDEGGIEILRHDICADILVDPVLIITGASDRTDRRIPDTITGLV